jgi:hypothetical protein
VLGSILKGSIILNLWPKPQAPYPGLAFNDLAEQSKQLEIENGCKRSGHLGRDTIYDFVHSLAAEQRGLNLANFVAN